jgi:putative transposase
MYDYRRMNPEERKRILELRMSKGYPLHKPPHPTFGEGWYFISAATFEHQPHFAVPNELTALERRLREAFQEAALPCAGWVVLPNHYHALVCAPAVASVGRALGAVHGRSARYANQRDGTPGRQVWFKFTDRKVRSERHYWTCMHYIICNPLKHWYIADILAWPWSCVHELIAEYGPQWVEDLMRDYPLRDFGKGWDD